jgi:ShK domain-like
MYESSEYLLQAPLIICAAARIASRVTINQWTMYVVFVEKTANTANLSTSLLMEWGLVLNLLLLSTSVSLSTRAAPSTIGLDALPTGLENSPRILLDDGAESGTKSKVLRQQPMPVAGGGACRNMLVLCDDYASYCSDTEYSECMRNYCPATCGVCGSSGGGGQTGGNQGGVNTSTITTTTTTEVPLPPPDFPSPEGGAPPGFVAVPDPNNPGGPPIFVPVSSNG